jgi:lipocalin-like protein
MKKIFILTAISVLFILGCKKTKPTSCTTDTASIAGSYKITAVTYKASSSSPEIDYFNTLFDVCERDDIYTFQTNGNYQVKDAGVVCSPNGDSFGTWSVSGNTMVIDGDPTSINSFDCHTLVIVNTDTQVSGDQLKLTLTKQ